MNRIFHYNISFIDIFAVLLLAALTFCYFWTRQLAVALPVAAIWVLVIERILHTTYTFMPTTLVVSGGRFSRRREIDYSAIVSYKPMSNCFGLVRYVLIEYGENKSVSVKPRNEALFMAEMTKRMTNKI